jgi:2-dehydro-3-deoxyphosphooctonate aldolase (KDO 8-P synthase)
VHKTGQKVAEVRISDDVVLGRNDLVLIAGPCVIESEAHALQIGREIANIARRAGLPYVFKASFDKANRTSIKSFRGPGLDEGLAILARVRRELGVPVLTDVHETSQVARAAETVDVLQIPAFLSRQTDLIAGAAASGRVVNIKKGQFLAPLDVGHAVAKVHEAGNRRVFVTERGFTYGYNNQYVYMRAFPMMRGLGVPVVYDVTHSLQLPGGGTGVSAGLSEYIEPLASAGVGAGVDGVFLEVHEYPAAAKSDGPYALPLARLAPLLDRLAAINAVVKAAVSA